MDHRLNLKKWARLETFRLFKQYEIPFFNVCVDVDVTAAHRRAKQPDDSFFIRTLYCSIRAANETESFRYRLRGDEVVIRDAIHPASTVLNTDETFSFCYFRYDPDYELFASRTSEDLARFKDGDRSFNPDEGSDEYIYYSVLPWIRFTSFAHARRFREGDSVPRLVFGKYYSEGGRIKMPVSVEVHHALMDGIHVGRFLEAFQDRLDSN